MRGRKLIMGVVGATQEVLGALAIIFNYILYYNLFDVQTWLNIPTEHVSSYVSFCLVLLFVFGFVSIISGFFLLRELLQ